MAYNKTNWVNNVTEVDATNMNHLEDGVEKAYGVELLAVVDTAPSECSVGDKYFNTTTNKIYVATATDTWSSEGVDAESGVFYVVFSEHSIYTYNGTTLIGVGSSGAGGESLPVGSIIAFAGSNAPEGYLMCDGSNVSRTANNDLFNVIGTTYGQGDGSTTFGLPNIKGRELVGLDTSQTEFDTLGETGGSKYLQAHTHKYATANGVFAGSVNNTWTGGGTQAGVLVNDTSQTTGGVSTITTGNSGNLQPYIVINYIIKAHPSVVNTSEVVNEHSTSETDVYSANQTNVEIENAISDKQDKGVVLYNSSSGSSSSITLSNNITNYDYVEINYTTTDTNNHRASTGKVLVSNNMELQMRYCIYSSGAMYDKMARVKINGTSLTWLFNGQVWYTNNGTNNVQENTTTIKILNVIGYK